MAEIYKQTAVCMDTFISIQIIRPPSIDESAELVEGAFSWFREVERCCSRFDPESELTRLTAQAGAAVSVSPLLYEVIQFAIAVAYASGGAFDPTVGHTLEARGFTRNYRTGQTAVSGIETDARCSYRDVQLDPARQAVTLRRPLVLDLGAVAKGFAIDLAARELGRFPNYSIDAGGDCWVRGRNAEGEPWSVGIRHPCRPDALIETLQLSDLAVCSSGGYERPAADGDGEHHIVDPRLRQSPRGVAGVTVVAPTAMLADALATAAFVLGPSRGLRLLDRYGVDGLIVAPSLEQFRSPGLARYTQ